MTGSLAARTGRPNDVSDTMHDSRIGTMSETVVARTATPAEVERWDDVVRSFPNHRVTHMRAWLAALEASVPGGRPLHLVAARRGAIVGVLPGLLTRLGPLTLFGSPLPGWQTSGMGPAFDDTQVSSRELVQAFLAVLEIDYGIHHMEMVSATLDDDVMRGLGFRPEEVPTYRAPLFPGDEPRTLRQFHDSARRNIRRAERLGLQVQFETDEAFVDDIYAQITEVFVRGGNLVPFRKTRVRAFFRCMQAGGHLVALSVRRPEGESIAAGLFTICGRELALWQWAHRPQYRWYRPTEIMTWAAMRRAMDAGCCTFDLMGEGVFKANFGAQRDVAQRRWVRSRYGWLTTCRDLAEAVYRRQQAWRGRVARALQHRRAETDADRAAAQGQSGNHHDA